MTTLAAIIAAIIAALAADLGTYDFSSTDAVLEGDYLQPPASAPFAAVLPAPLGTTPRARERLHLHEVSVTVRLWVPWTTDTPPARAAASRTLMDEARTALEAARRTGGNALYRCERFVVSAATPGTAPQATPPEFVLATLTIELTYLRLAGTGA